MPYEVEAFGKIIEIPDGVSHADAYQQIMANRHKLDPEYKPEPVESKPTSARDFIEKNFLGFDSRPTPSLADQAEATADEGANTATPKVPGAPVRQSYYNQALIDNTLGMPVTERFRKPDLNGITARVRQAADQDLKGQANQQELELLRTEALKPSESGFTQSVLNSAGRTIKGAGQVGSDFIGADKDNPITQYGQKLLDDNPLWVKQLGDIKDEPFLAFKEASGNSAPSMGAMISVGALGAGITSVAPLTGPVAPIVAAVGQAVKWLGPAAVAALPSYSGIRDAQILKDPKNEADAKSKAIAALGASAVGAIEVAFGPQQWAIAMLTKEGRAAMARKFASTSVGEAMIKGGLVGAASEGAEEIVQNPIEQLASYEDPTTKKNLQDTLFGGAMGAIGGAGPGSIVGGASQIAEQTNARKISNIANSQTLDEAIDAAVKPTVTKEDVLRTVDPTLADIEAATGIKPSEAINHAETQAQTAPAEVLNSPESRQNSSLDIVLPDNSSVKAQWRVVDADQLAASMKEDVNQPRDRTRAASETQIEGIAKAPNYKLVSDSPVMDVGAPVIDQDGRIVAGNGRFEGLRRAYERGTASEYLDNLRADAANKGLSIEGVKNPILVRQLTEPVNTRKVAISSNSGMSLQYSPLETAKLDAERMKGIEGLQVNDLGDIALTTNNAEKLRDVLGDYQDTELSAMVDKHWRLSQEGVKRVRNAMLAKAYGSSPVLEKLVESTDQDMRNVLGALTKSAAHVISTKGNTKALLEAVDTYAQLKATGQPVDNFLAQRDAFSEGLSKEAEGILRFIDTNARSQKKLTDFIKGNFREVDTTSADMFEQPTVEQQLETHLKKNGYEFNVEPASMRDFDALDSTKKARAELADKIGKVFKKKVRFVKADGPFGINGVMVPGIVDTIFVDIRTPKPFDAIVGHELSHWMEVEKPEVYKQLVKSLRKVIKDEGFAKKYGIEGVSNSYITKEIVGDIMGDNFTDQKFWDKVAEANPKAFKDIAAAIIKWLKGIITKAKANGMGSEQWVTDATKARDILAEAVAQYTGESETVGTEGGVKFNANKKTVMVDGVERPTENSEGKLINNPVNFWKWFGDSEVVDNQGRPLVVYHGAKVDITTFDKDKLGENTLGNASDESFAATSLIGFWFNSEPMSEKARSTYTVDMPIYIKAESVRDEGSLGNLSQSVGEYLTGDLIEDYDNDLFNYANNAASNYVDRLERNGYDGIKIVDEEFGGISYAVFTPNQIKSTIGNNGDYSSTNDDIRFSRAYHGSPHDHNKFDSGKIGTGEGAQAYGYGHYFTDSKGVAEFYRDSLAKEITVNGKYGSPITEVKQEAAKWIALEAHTPGTLKQYADNESYVGKIVTAILKGKIYAEKGKLYEVELAPKQDEYLLWDKPLSEQSDKVKDAINKLPHYDRTMLGGRYYDALSSEFARKGGGAYVSELMHSIGIRGIKYLDGTSRGKGEGSYNYVVFDDSDIEITAKFSRAEEYGYIFETGKPVTFTYLHNKASATKIFGKPKKDSRFNRYYDPSGKYVIAVPENREVPDYGDYEKGVLTFNNPLVIDNDNLNWKVKLSNQYGGLRGKNLSKAVIADGYDGLVTVDADSSGKTYPSEILDLTSFDESKAKFSKQEVTLSKVMSQWDDMGVDGFAHENNWGITLSKIIVPKHLRNEGVGTRAMNQLMDYADATGQRIALTPSNDFGGSKARLNKFYAKLGFKSNKDFSIMERLVREPNAKGAYQSRSETIDVDGVERPALNSNGKPIYPTDEGIRNFWRWFGDSKVIDSKGRPLVVYHGTNQDFNIFDPKRHGENTPAASSIAHFFTEQHKEAEEYSDLASRTQLLDAVQIEKKSKVLQTQIKQAEVRGDWNTAERLYLTLEELELGAINADPSGQHVLPVYLYAKDISFMDMGDSFDGHVVAKEIRKAKRNGLDGLKLDNVFDPVGSNDREGFGSTTQWVVFRSNQIKSAIGNNGKFSIDSDDVRFSRAPKLYSKLEQALNDAPDKIFSTGSQVKLWLQSNAGKLGVKKDEIYWSGIDNWLDAQGKVSKQQVVEFVRNNGVKVEDVTLGGDKEFNTIRDKLDRMLLDELNDRPVDKEEQNKLEKKLAKIKNTEPKHNNDKLTLPGGENYRELVVTVPTVEPYNQQDATHFGDTGEGKQIGWLRLNERDGGLFIEELQSQRAQQGRSKGFARKLTLAERKELDQLTKKTTQIREKLAEMQNAGLDETPEYIALRAERFNMNPRLRELNEVRQDSGEIPPAPFVSDANNKATNAYIGLLMKKALIEAVSNDLGSVTWTTGDQQADRYDLSKHIDEVHYSGTNLKAYDLDGNTVIDTTGVREEDLPDYIGKDAANKLLSQPKNGTLRSLYGADLKTGGEWAQSMYGNEQGLNLQGKPSLMSQAANDIFKHVGSGKIESINGQPGFRVTPEMKSKDLPLFSKVEPPPGESRFRKFQRLNQDSFNRFTVIKEWLAEHGVKLSDKADVYGAEERYHSKAANQLEDFREQVRNPLIEKIAKAGYTLGDVEVFLKMQHAKEANAAIRKIGGDTAYGITDDEADDYMQQAPKELADLSNALRDITEDTKKLRLDNGILNTDVTDAWESTYKHYIPVKGETDAERGVGKGLKINFKSKRRLGHALRDEHVIENILMDHERAILEVERNRVIKHLMMMAAEMQRPDILSIGQPEKRKVLKTDTAYTVEANGVVQGAFKSESEAKIFKQLYATATPSVAPSAIVISKTKDQRVIATTSPMLADNEIVGYVDGHAVRMQVKDELMARALMKLGVEQFSDIVAAGRILNGYLSKMYTGYNPEFILTNMVRDFTSGFINLTGEQGAVMATRALLEYPRMFVDLFRYAVSNGKRSTKWIDSYRANGGNTGAAYLSDMERLGNEVNTEYASYQGVVANLKAGDRANAARAAGRKVFNASFKWIYNLNQAGENAMRLAAFKAMIDSKRTVNEAAKVAKNITVNFNRKGERQWTPALYLFYNASVQGTAATLHALTKGKHKYQAQALAAGMVTIGYIAASALGGGSEDDYDEINDYTKERNLIIKSGDGYVKIPVPYGYGFFYNLGRNMADAQRTGEWGAMPWHLATSAISEFTPFNDVVVGSDNEFRSDQVFMGFMPTAAKIAAQPIFNKQLFSGGELMPESPFDKSQPDRQKMFRGTKGTMYDEVAGWMETAGFDVSPETLKYLTRTATGGAGSLVDTTISAAMLKGEGAELDTGEIPFVRKGYMELTIKDKRAAYYKAREEAHTAAEEFNRARRDNDVAKMEKVIKDKGELIGLSNYADRLAEVIAIERDRQDAVRNDKKLSVKEKRVKLKSMEAEEAQFYDQYLDVFKTSKFR